MTDNDMSSAGHDVVARFWIYVHIKSEHYRMPNQYPVQGQRSQTIVHSRPAIDTFCVVGIQASKDQSATRIAA